MLKCYVEGRNLVNGVEQQYDVVEGAVFTENYNETLDSGTIILPHLSAEIEIEPYDIVVVFSTNNKMAQKRMCVDTYVCTQTSLDPAIYKYEISLFSETKLLEGILLPSVSITSLKTGSRSIYHYLVSFLDQYCPKTMSNDTDGPYNNKFSFASRVASKFTDDVPEFQWNEPNLREVLTDLMMVKNCIPVIHNNVIDYIDISQVGSEITSIQRQGINYIQKSQSSADYVSEIKARLQNSVGKDEVSKICEKITWRNNNDYVLTTENIKVETNFPIYKLINFTMYVPFPYTLIKVHNIDDPTDEEKNPIFSNYYVLVPYVLFSSIYEGVLEYQDWQTRDIYYGSTNMGYTTNFQNTCLYYVRGQKGIYNFNAKQEKSSFWGTKTKYIVEAIFDELVNKPLPDYPSMAERYAKEQFLRQYPQYDDPEEYTIEINGMDHVDTGWKKCYFELEYETLGNHSMFVSKGTGVNDYFPRNKRQVVDNQTQSYIVAKTHGILEYMKANRLGNKLKVINGRYEDEASMPTLAQTINGSVIFKKEIAVYENFVKVNYQATDGYVLRDYFTGIKSKLRSWNILSGEECFVRADNIKFYINSNIQSIDTGNYRLPVYSTLQEYINKFKYCVVYFKVANSNTTIPNRYEIEYKGNNYEVNGYLLEFQKIISGNSVLFTIRMLDNAIVGRYICDDNYEVTLYEDGEPTNLRVPAQKNCRYVDGLGENIGGTICFYENCDIGNNTSENQEALRNLLPAVPLGSTTYSGFSGLRCYFPFHFKKDNREITQITIQFEMNANANDIFLGKK